MLLNELSFDLSEELLTKAAMQPQEMKVAEHFGTRAEPTHFPPRCHV
jgi:hypothetical protein